MKKATNCSSNNTNLIGIFGCKLTHYCFVRMSVLCRSAGKNITKSWSLGCDITAIHETYGMTRIKCSVEVLCFGSKHKPGLQEFSRMCFFLSFPV